MSEYKKLLIPIIEIVTFLLSAFGGALLRIAPPDDVGASYPAGLAALIALAVFLLISARIGPFAGRSARRNWSRAGTLLLVLALPLSLTYSYLLSHYTYPRQIELSLRHVSAPDRYLSADAANLKSQFPSASAEFLSERLPDDDVWSRTGIETTETELLSAYIGLIIAFAGGIFCLLEVMRDSEAKRRG